MKSHHFIAIGVALLLGLAGCAAPAKYDYTAFRAHQPRSILVLPPMNESTDIKGTYSYLSTVTAPVVDRGYYVFPVEVVDLYLKENGVTGPAEARQISLSKYGEIVGADALLDITIKQYGTHYQLINSATVVEANAKLVDIKSGTLLWQGHVLQEENTDSANTGSPLGNLLATLVTAAIDQIGNTITDHAHDVSRIANSQLSGGLLPGPYAPKQEEKK
jgi:hypothetical protein